MGGSEQDHEKFKTHTKDLSNVIHKRMTSGEAFKNWEYGPVSFVFIDALHAYVNTAFDIEAWASLLVKGGIIAVHDTDQSCFAGTRKAVFECTRRSGFELWTHPDNLTLLQRR